MADLMDLKDTYFSSDLAAEQGQRIKQLRKRTHLSRRAFAKKHGIAPGSLQNWEDGRYKRLSLQGVEVLVLAFNAENIPCTVEYLLYGATALAPHSEKQEANQIQPNLQTANVGIIDRAHQYAKQHQINKQLLLAVVNGRSEEIENLIKLGCTIHLETDSKVFKFYNDDENSPLHVASRTGHFNVLKILIGQGSQVDLKNKFKQTPLHLAVKKGYLEIVNYLVLNGADINLKDSEGNTALAWACKYGQTAIARQLVKLGAQTNIKNLENNHCIHWAASHGYIDIVALLLEHGAKINEKNIFDETPLICAIKNGHAHIAQLLGSESKSTISVS